MPKPDAIMDRLQQAATRVEAAGVYRDFAEMRREIQKNFDQFPSEHQRQQREQLLQRLDAALGRVERIREDKTGLLTWSDKIQLARDVFGMAPIAMGADRLIRQAGGIGLE